MSNFRYLQCSWKASENAVTTEIKKRQIKCWYCDDSRTVGFRTGWPVWICNTPLNVLRPFSCCCLSQNHAHFGFCWLLFLYCSPMGMQRSLAPEALSRGLSAAGQNTSIMAEHINNGMLPPGSKREKGSDHSPQQACIKTTMYLCTKRILFFLCSLELPEKLEKHLNSKDKEMWKRPNVFISSVLLCL